MKYARVTMLALAALTSVAFAACASGSDTDPFGTGGGGAGGGGGSSGSVAPDGGDVCATTCGTDLDCQNSCPDVPTGSNCCDKATAKCYVSSEAICPSPQDGGSGSGGMLPY